MKIRDEHLEWASVRRMRDMLLTVREEYKVTQTYALFTAILCWVMQRVRANGDEEYDRRAQAVYTRLAAEKAKGAPWRLRTDGQSPHLWGFEFTDRSPIQQVEELPVADLLIALRNAVAHGDARTILPVNRDRLLVGQRFLVSARDWKGNVELRRHDMKRIAQHLADRFCAALEERRESEPWFVEDAQSVRETSHTQSNVRSGRARPSVRRRIAEPGRPSIEHT